MRRGFSVILALIWVVSGVITPGLAWARIPNDPFVTQWSYDLVGVPEAWNYTTGSRNVVVAVIDNGIVTSHQDLAENIWHNDREIADNDVDDDNNGYIDDMAGWDFVSGDNDPTPDAQTVIGDNSDIEISHGTAVAGIIGAVGNNSRDGAGVAWQVRLMNLRVADNKGTGYVSGLAPAIRYAVENGADIINLSINSDSDDAELTEALRLAVDRGVAVFAAAGNLGQSYSQIRSFPVCSDGDEEKQWVIGVSAVGEDRRLSQFSSYGDCIDLTAPGEKINSASWYGTAGYAYGWSGTSFATPFVSGAAALIKALRPEWKADDIYRAMITRVSHSCSTSSLADDAGYREWYGSGLLRIDRAVRAAAVGPWKASNSQGVATMPSLNIWAGSSDGSVDDWSLPTTTAQSGVSLHSHSSVEILDKVYAVASYHDFPCTRYFAVAKADDKKNQRVTVYDTNWEPVGSWSVAATAPVLLAFSQVGNEPVRLAVTTGRAGKIVADLYSVTGERVGAWQLPKAHRGVTNLTSVQNKGEQWLAAVVSQTKNNQVMVAQNDHTMAKLDVPRAEYRLASGDFNGTGAGTIMLAPAVANPTVKLYGVDLVWQLSYRFQAPGIKWDWSVGDYNDDGRADTILYPTVGTSTARVYDFGGRVIEEKNLFTDNPSGRRWLVWP